MTHQNISSLLEQYDIVSFEDFRRRSYRERSAFLKHIKHIIELEAKNELTELLSTIEQEPGLKMCFRVSRDNSGAWINIPNEIFAKKLAFLTSRTIILFPFYEISTRRSKDVEALITLLCATRPFLGHGYITIVPANPKNTALRQTIDRLMPANFQLPKLEAQFEEKAYPTHYKNLYSPLLNRISNKEIIEIRKMQKQLHERMEHRLERDLMNMPFDEKILLHEIQDINSYIIELDQLIHDIKTSINKGMAYRVAFMAMSACAGLAVLPSTLSSIAALAGSYQFKDIINAILDEKGRLARPEKSDFFISWKVNHPGELISLKGLLKHALNLKEHTEDH